MFDRFLLSLALAFYRLEEFAIVHQRQRKMTNVAPPIHSEALSACQSKLYNGDHGYAALLRPRSIPTFMLPKVQSIWLPCSFKGRKFF